MAHHENTTTFRAAFLAALLARHYPDAQPYTIASIVNKMQRETKKALAYENRCNINPCDAIDDYNSRYKRPPLTSQGRADIMAEHQAMLDKLESKMERVQAGLNLALLFSDLRTIHDDRDGAAALHASPARVELGGDPRGPCGSVIIPGVRGDGFGDGFAIY